MYELTRQQVRLIIDMLGGDVDTASANHHELVRIISLLAEAESEANSDNVVITIPRLPDRFL